MLKDKIPSCMTRYKSEFIIKFGQLMSENLQEWKKEQKTYRKKLYTTDLLIYLGAFGLGFVPGKREHDYFNNLWMHFWLGIIFMIGAIFMEIAFENKEYQNSVKKTFFQKLISVFGKNIYYNNSAINYLLERELENSYTDDDELNESLKSLEKFSDGDYPHTIGDKVFEQCGLYNKQITQRDDDDGFYGIYNGVKFTLNETDFGWNSNDKHNTYHSMFKGVAMRFQMNKKINARVLIYSKSILAFKNITNGFEKVELEDMEFSKKYDVYVNHIHSDGQIEARYLLNTAFINRFMELKTSFHAKGIKLSVTDDTMLVMLETNRDLFEMNHLLGKIDDVNQYNNLFNEFASVFSFMDVLNLSSKTKL